MQNDNKRYNNNNFNNNYRRNNNYTRNRKRFRGIKNVGNNRNRNRNNQIYKKWNNAGNKKIRKFRNRLPRKSNRINRQIDQLTEDIKNLNITLMPKATNLQKRTKEPRYDQVITPMNMALHNRLISIFPTSNRVVKTAVYTKFDLLVHQQRENTLLWFPYALPFANPIPVGMRADDIPTVMGEWVDTLCNLIPLYGSMAEPILDPPECGKCGVQGSYRLIGATMKIKSTTAPMTREGDYTIYKINDEQGIPMLYNSGATPAANNSDVVKDYVIISMSRDYMQTTIKQNFSCNDVVTVNEYNVNEGNNIFSGQLEYLSSAYISGGEQPSALLRDKNPLGSNIKYLLKFTRVSTTQHYVIETWQDVEIVPNPGAGLGNLASVVERTFDKEVVKEMQTIIPFDKA